MTTDARIQTSLPSHPKTKKLVRKLGADGAWKLVCLFLWAAGNRSDGDLSGMSADDIELAVDWSGDEGAFVGALIDVGFLDSVDGVFSIHDWETHNPWANGASARSEKARWAAMCKQHGRPEAARLMPEYANRMLDAVPDSATSTLLAESRSAPSPSPSPSPEAKTMSVSTDYVTETPDQEQPKRTIPVAAILSAYHEHLPMLTAVRKMTDNRKRKLKARWCEDAERQSVEYWDKFFAYVAQSDFLTGRDNRWTACDFEWLIEPSNHVKVIEGKYENRGQA